MVWLLLRHFRRDVVWRVNDSRVAESVGALIGIYQVCEFVFSYFWGALADRFGRRVVLLVGLAGSAVAPLVCGASGGVRETRAAPMRAV